MSAALGRVILYSNKTEALVAFYSEHFGYEVIRRDGDRIVELRPTAATGAAILLHPAARGRREGQSVVKLVFDVRDVPAFREAAAHAGLAFGPVHDGGGYVFANARDPAGNPVSISSRAFADAMRPE